MTELRYRILQFRLPHCRLGEMQTALHWLSWLRLRHPENLQLFLTLGYVQLSLGQSAYAASTLKVNVPPSSLKAG